MANRNAPWHQLEQQGCTIETMICETEGFERHPPIVSIVPRVLISTDEPNFTLGLVEGYRAAGCEVVTGTANFRLRASHYDIVHHQWPEEFSRWQAPSPTEIEQVKQHLEWWRDRATNIFTVNNLYPHELDRNPACHELYSSFYRSCQVITHYSNASREMVLAEYPAARTARHVVHHPANYEVSLASQKSRGSRRSEMGISDNEFVILMLGSLRSWDEVRLIQRAFDLATVPNKRLLMAGKLKSTETKWQRKARQLTWQWWLKRRRAIVDTRYVPESEVSQFVDSCDVAIVPRLSGISSGIVNLAMTFGRAVIAPRHGAYPEYFAGTANPLYETGNAKSLAAALDQAAKLDLNKVGSENARIASKWTWKEMCEVCLAAGNVGDFRISCRQQRMQG
jgi:glycosyltransferase involved in cell wall biosynthesis